SRERLEAKLPRRVGPTQVARITLIASVEESVEESDARIAPGRTTFIKRLKAITLRKAPADLRTSDGTGHACNRTIQRFLNSSLCRRDGGAGSRRTGTPIHPLPRSDDRLGAAPLLGGSGSNRQPRPEPTCETLRD